LPYNTSIVTVPLNNVLMDGNHDGAVLRTKVSSFGSSTNLKMRDQQKSNVGVGFTTYFLEKVSELPAKKTKVPLFQNQSQHDVVTKENCEEHVSFDSSTSFPSKLYQMLEDAETKGFEDLVSWQPDGKSFKAQKVEGFVKDVLPLYFGQIKYKSFQRQLNLYGFSRVHKGLTRGSYTHELFVRGRKPLSLNISRQKWTPSSHMSTSSNPTKVDFVSSISGWCWEESTSLDHTSNFTFRPTFKEGGTSSRTRPSDIYIMDRTRTKQGEGELSLKNDTSESSFATQSAELPRGRHLQHLPSIAEPYELDREEWNTFVKNREGPSAMAMDLASISSDTSFSGVLMPSSTELSFLFDCDGSQQKQGWSSSSDQQEANETPNQDRSYQEHLLASGANQDVAQSLQAVANTIPSASDLAMLFRTEDSGTRCETSSSEPTSEFVPVQIPAGTARNHFEERSFPWKLHDMLNEAESNGFQDMISWEPDGMAFKVHDCHLFVKKVMPLYFDKSRYESFRRQLRKYGFARLDKDRYRGAYYHKCFQRANRPLCRYITRANGVNKKRARSSDNSLKMMHKQGDASRGLAGALSASLVRL
jgi:hypothetical protein